MSRMISVAVLALAAGPLGCEPPTIRVSEQPLRVLEDRAGAGPVASAGHLVTITLRVEEPDGRLVMSDDRYRFIIGTETVIDGVDEAVRGMRLGGARVVECPPHKHWGRNGYADGAIPPDTRLILRLRLIGLEVAES